MNGPRAERVVILEAAVATFTTPWGEGSVTVAGGCPRAILLPWENGGAGAETAAGGGPSVLDQRLAQSWAGQLDAYFAGRRRGWTRWEVDMSALEFSTFQSTVYGALLTVPAGSTVSYGRLAEMAGHRGAARAVGTAMARNPLPIVIPCHRVVREDGSLGQYGAGGPLWKERLLELERGYR